jgi:uncharacterized protein HemX
MKNVMQTIFASAVVMGTLLTSCSPSSKNVENAETNVAIAAQELEDEKKAYRDDLDAFRTKTQDLFDTNEKAMAAFTLSIANQKSAVKLEHEKNIAALQAKNAEMKEKLADFDENNHDQWDAFKKEFSNDMEQLGEAIRAFSVKPAN